MTIRNAVHCRDCASLISPTANTCPRCGGRQNIATGGLGATTPSGKNRVVAALLALFLGGFGVHKFYLGRIGWGIVYLIFCWTFVPALIALIEAIVYLTMSEEQFETKYG
ncbi:TM2 domain-containing protein [Sphingosinithalassobacter tenebrarum]|uniref:TM2 domain-containing protein n=2 Tax=Stakelama tenebrarum TaxID=2711215 RepID=A0A6G6Y9X7_9SPHN|nr:TM2 domain-containing protein [Sphingosinithalassobacter tenebrarum]